MEISTSLQELYRDYQEEKIPLVFWGIGEFCDAYYTILKLGGITPLCIGDRDENKIGAYFKNTPIMSAGQILALYPRVNILLTGKKELLSEDIHYLSIAAKQCINTKIKIFQITDKGTLSAELLTYYRKSQLKREDFSILSNTCFAYDIYGYLDIEPQTPTARMIIWPLHYLKFLEKLDYYLTQPLQFKHMCITPRQDYSNVHVLASVGDIDIHFVHDSNFETAKARWDAGIEKLNLKNLFVVMEDAHFPLTRSIAERFDKLPYKNKVLLTQYDFPGLSSVCRYSAYKNWLRCVLNINQYIRYERFDILKWLNDGGAGSEYEIKNLGDNLSEEYLEWLYSGGMPIYNKIYKLMLYGDENS